LKTRIGIVFCGIIVYLILPNDNIFAQDQKPEDFLEWPAETNYNLLFIAIAIFLVVSVMANYFWSNRKGRRFSAE